MVGLAAAPDYIDDFYNNLPVKKKKELNNKGFIKYSSYGFSYLVKKKYILNGRENKILNKEFKWNKPLILIQGLKDNVVKPNLPEKIVKKIKGNQIQIKLLKNSDHRLSKPFDLKVINEAVDSILKN
jgi:esterase/lipase